MSYIDYLGTNGKEGLKARYWKFVATEAADAAEGVSMNADPVALAETCAWATIDNTATVTGDSDQNVIVMPVYIKLQCTVAGNGSEWSFNFYLDNATRWASGGTTPPAVRTWFDTTSGFTEKAPKGEVHVGDLVVTTNSAENLIARTNVAGWGGTTGLSGFALGNEYIFAFGAEFGGSGGTYRDTPRNVTAGAEETIGSRQIIPMDPVWIGRQCSLVMKPVGISASVAPAFNVEVAVVELGHSREDA